MSEQINKADEMLGEGDYSAASDILREILYEEPDQLEALWRLGVAFTELDQPEKAIKTLNYFFKFDRDNPEALEAFGCSHFKLGNYGVAKSYLEKAFKLDPKSSSVARNLGVTYNQLGNFSKSFELMEKAYEMNPWDYRTIYALASAHIFFQRYEEAEILLKEMLEMDIPTDFKQLALEGRKKIESKLKK